MPVEALQVVVAPDKFKGSLDAVQVCTAIEAGLRRDHSMSVTSLPIADGGDGTLLCFRTSGYEYLPFDTRDHHGDVVHAGIARRGTTAVVELAMLCGLARLHGRTAPMRASTWSVGEGVLFAVDSGCDEVVVAVGGSASTDGGTGFAAAMGVVFRDKEGQPVEPNGAGLVRIASVDTSKVDPRARRLRRLVIATDVDNPLYGDTGAAYVYAPQKSASAPQVAELDAGLRNLAAVLVAATGLDVSGLPGAGAAGGIASTAVALFGATIEPGAELILGLLGVPDAVARADLVVTGEGTLDRQTLSGKGPIAVVRSALKYGVPVVAFCGRRLLTDEELAAHGIARAFALADLEPDPDVCMRDAARLLTAVAKRSAPILHALASSTLRG